MQPRPITANDAASSSANGTGSQKIITGTPTVGSTVSVRLALNPPVPDVVFTFSSTFVGAAEVENSYDGGQSWIGPISLNPVGGGNAVTSMNAPGVVSMNPGLATNSRARATSFSNGSMNVAISPGIPPALPGQVRLTLTPGVTQNLLIWGAIPGATGYNVYSGTATGTETLLAGNQAGPTYTDTGLTANSAHYYYVTVIGITGEGLPSNEVIGIVKPSAPTSLGATGSASQIVLAWTAPSGGADSYNIYRGLSAGTEGPIPIANVVGVAYNDTHVVFGTAYYYVVKAVNASGESVASNEANATATGQAAPTSLAVASVTSTTIGLTWVAAAGATTYNLYRGTVSNGQATAPVHTLITGTSFTDTGLTNGVTYFYKMTAVSSVGQSVKSNEASGTAGLVAPATPANLAAVGTVGGAYIQWSASVGATTYDLQSSPDGTTWTNLSMAQAPLFFADTTGHTNYRVRATNIVGSSAYTANPGAVAGPPLLNMLTWLRSVQGFTVSTWTDQSGAGHNATQATAGSQFSLVASVLGGKSVVRSVDFNRIMDLPNIMPINASFSCFVLFKLSSQGTSSGSTISGPFTDISFDLTLGGNSGVLLLHSGFSTESLLTSNTANPNPQVNWMLTLLTFNEVPNLSTSANTYEPTFYTNGHFDGTSSSPLPDCPTFPNVSIGGIQGTANAGLIGDMAEVGIASGYPNVDQANNLINMVNATYGLTFPTLPKQVLFLGDSITAGGGVTFPNPCWATQCTADNSACYYTNNGISGAATSDIIAAQTTRIDPFISTKVPSVVVLFAGTNDLFNSVSPATAYANLVMIANRCRSLGATKIIAVTMLPRDLLETQRQTLCNLIVANADGAFTVVADVRTLPMGAPGANDSLTYYDSSHIHPNDAGHTALHGLIGPLI